MSVVVPTFERGTVLARTVAALRAQTFDGAFEVIVVDDGSTEPSASTVARAVASLPNARLLRQANAGPAVARNAGYRAGAGRLVAFLDDDCEPAPDWLAQLVLSLADGEDDVAAVGGRVLPAPATNWVSRFCAAVEYSSGIQPVFENAATANACYRRSVLEELDGFDEGFRYPGGDDPDLSRRARQAGYRLVFVPDAIVYHTEFESYWDFVAHMYRRGIGEALLARKAHRELRAVGRAVLLPVFLSRTAMLCWRATTGKGNLPIRLFWVALESIGRLAFVAGSLRGLVARR